MWGSKHGHLFPQNHLWRESKKDTKGLCKISITQPLISHRGLRSLLVKASPNTKGVGMTQDTEACQTQTHGHPAQDSYEGNPIWTCLNHYILKKVFFISIVCVIWGRRLLWPACGGQRTTLGSWSSLSTFTWILGIRLRLPGLDCPW